MVIRKPSIAIDQYYGLNIFERMTRTTFLGFDYMGVSRMIKNRYPSAIRWLKPSRSTAIISRRGL